jgi:hypothetical protein
MATLLLIQPRETAALSARRIRARERLRARLCPARLDAALAAGAPADARGDLSIRAHRLISLRARQRLAAEITDILEHARRPPHRLASIRPVPGVLRAAPLLLELADQLSCPGPVDACGVARIRLLLRDGTGPVYNDDLEPACLEQMLSRALLGLIPTTVPSR